MTLSRNTLHGKTPRLQVTLFSGGVQHTVNLMPDSGATCSITDISNILKWKLPMDTVNPEDFNVTTMTGQGIKIVANLLSKYTMMTRVSMTYTFL